MGSVPSVGERTGKGVVVVREFSTSPFPGVIFFFFFFPLYPFFSSFHFS